MDRRTFSEQLLIDNTSMVEVISLFILVFVLKALGDVKMQWDT